jgi:natural resistance-associated macrophage protein
MPAPPITTPSGIATYSQAGVQFGFELNWTVLLIYLLTAVVWETSRIGRTAGKSIAANIRKHYPAWCSRPLFFLSAPIPSTQAGDLDAMADAAAPISAAGLFFEKVTPAYALITW